MSAPEHGICGVCACYTDGEGNCLNSRCPESPTYDPEHPAAIPEDTGEIQWDLDACERCEDIPIGRLYRVVIRGDDSPSGVCRSCNRGLIRNDEIDSQLEYDIGLSQVVDLSKTKEDYREERNNE